MPHKSDPPHKNDPLIGGNYLNRHPDLTDALGANNVAAAQNHQNDHGQSEGRDSTCPAATYGEGIAGIQDAHAGHADAMKCVEVPSVSAELGDMSARLSTIC